MADRDRFVYGDGDQIQWIVPPKPATAETASAVSRLGRQPDPADPSSDPADPSTETAPETAAARRNVNRLGDDPTAAIDAMLADLARSEAIAAAFEPIATAAETAFEAASSYEDLSRRLKARLATLTPTEMSDLLARAQFAARLAGETGAT